MDKLLSSFTRTYIDTFTPEELINLNDLLNLDDENLYKFNCGKKIPIVINKNKVTELFKIFVYKKK